MLHSKTAIAATVGLVLFVAGLGWGAVYDHLQKLNDPPGWIMDRPFYPPAGIMANVGFYLFGLAVLFGIVRWIYSTVRASISSSIDQV